MIDFYIIGEVPVDDIKLLEEQYQKSLKDLLLRRGIREEELINRVLQLIPDKGGSVYYVGAHIPPPTVQDNQEES